MTSHLNAHNQAVAWSVDFGLVFSSFYYSTFTFTFTFGEDSMLSSAEAVISFGPMGNSEITERLYKSLWGFCKPQKSVWLNLLKFCDIH